MKQINFTKLLRFKYFFKNNKILSKILDKLFRIIFSNNIPSTVYIGNGTKFAHSGLGCIVHPNTKIGINCKIFQNVTIYSGDKNDTPPIIGDNVYIGAGAVILGNIKIENNVKIGAKAVVTKDVESGRTVFGVQN